MLAEGATDVALDGGIVFEEVHCLSPMEWAGGLERLLKVLGVCAMLTGLRPSSAVGRNTFGPCSSCHGGAGMR
jgi:hypothetical protein